ncbi:hypothetical protein DL98DRAFT_518977 [Cadophora sp. DSE1049]|nr:hypothetical protein DL98DRAFT_518977 [Cadophora sp. DSE1049]
MSASPQRLSNCAQIQGVNEISLLTTQLQGITKVPVWRNNSVFDVTVSGSPNSPTFRPVSKHGTIPHSPW